jgi:hypothetical protein
VSYYLYLFLHSAQNFTQTARVVIMTVTQDNPVDVAQVNANRVSIIDGGTPLSGIEQDSCLVCLDEDAQSPLAKEIAHAGSIIT